MEDRGQGLLGRLAAADQRHDKSLLPAADDDLLMVAHSRRRRAFIKRWLAGSCSGCSTALDRCEAQGRPLNGEHVSVAQAHRPCRSRKLHPVHNDRGVLSMALELERGLSLVAAQASTKKSARSQRNRPPAGVFGSRAKILTCGGSQRRSSGSLRYHRRASGTRCRRTGSSTASLGTPTGPRRWCPAPPWFLVALALVASLLRLRLASLGRSRLRPPAAAPAPALALQLQSMQLCRGGRHEF